MAQGTIKKLVKDRGFGFISSSSGKGDVFFHVSAVADGAFDALQEGQSVEFEIVEDGGRGERSTGRQCPSRLREARPVFSSFLHETPILADRGFVFLHLAAP